MEHLSMRSFWSHLPRPARWLLCTTVFQVLGRGMTLPFTVIYLHEVRGLTLDVAGTMMALIGLVALVFIPAVGALTDRWGARVMVIAASLSQVIGLTLLAFADDEWRVVVAIFFIGMANAGGWTTMNVLIASLVTGTVRQTFFGINFALVNLGIGVGGVISGLFVDVHRPDTFTTIFLVNAVCMLIPIGLMLGPLRAVDARSAHPAGEAVVQPGYLAILRRPGVLQISAIGLVFSFVGYGQMEAGFPAWSREVSQVSTEVIGWAFALNTLVIVCFQFLALRLIQGHRRTRVVMVMAAIWAVSWLVLGTTGPFAGTALAAAMVMAFFALFAVGETLLQPTLPAITNDLAPDHLRGRYNALSSGAFQVGAVAGPLVAGFMLRHDLHVEFIAVILAGCGLMALAAGALERRITGPVNGLPAPDEAVWR